MNRNNMDPDEKARYDELRAKKKFYRTLIKRAQDKYRYQSKKAQPSVEYIEASHTGGQFSFRDIKSIEDLNVEITRAQKFLNSQLLDNKAFKKAAERGAEPYMDIFRKGVSEEERYEAGLPDEGMEEFWRMYRKLEESPEGAILLAGGYESDTFIAYLYSYKVDGYSEEQIQNIGHEFLTNLNRTNVMHDTDIPVTSQTYNYKSAQKGSGRRYGRRK